MRADWTVSGACTNGSTALQRGGTTAVCGGGTTTSTTSRDVVSAMADGCTMMGMGTPGHGWPAAAAGPMAIVFVLGVMDVRAMAAVTAAITLERLAPAGESIARAIGVVFVGAGLFLIARAAGLA